MVDLKLDVDLELEGLQRFKRGVRDAEGELRRLGAAGRSYSTPRRDASGRFLGGGYTQSYGPGIYRDAAGRLRGPGGRFAGGGGSGFSESERDSPGARFKDYGGRMQSAGRGMSDYARNTGYALAGLVAPAEDFERAITDVVAVTDDAAYNIANEKKLRDAAQGYAKIGVKATDAARAMEFLALAGYDTNQTIGATKHVFDAARAGSEDVIKTAGFLTDTATGFGFGVDEFQRVSDVMTYINNETNTTLSLTASAMKEIGPYAQQVGISFENMAAAVGVLASSGFKGRQAGTAIRNMLLSFAKMSKPAREELEKLGLSQEYLVSTFINKGDLQGAIVALDKAMTNKGYEAGDKLRVSSTIFERFTAGKELALAIDMSKALSDPSKGGMWNKLTEGAKGSTGATAKIAARKLDSDAGRLDVARAKLDAMQVKLSQKILPALLPVGEELVDTLEDLSGWVEKHPHMVSIITKWTAGSTLLLGVLGPGVRVIGSATSAFGSLASAVDKASWPTQKLADGLTGGLGGAADASNKKVYGLSNALGAAGLVAAAAGAGVAIGTFVDDMWGISDKLALLGYNPDGSKKTPHRGAGYLTAEEQSESSSIDARIAELKTKTTGREVEVARFMASQGDDSRMGPIRAAEQQIADLERRKAGLVDRARVRSEVEGRNLAQYQPMITARAAELDKMRSSISHDAAEWEGMKGTVGGRSRQDRMKTSALAELQLRKAKLESENSITQAKVERMGVGLKKGEDWRTKAELKFNPIEVRVAKGLEVNKDAGEFTLGF
jgi:TP901 family phage tail tape measure protein